MWRLRKQEMENQIQNIETIKINNKFELVELLKRAQRPHFSKWDTVITITEKFKPTMYTLNLIPITDEFNVVAYEIPAEVWNTSASNGAIVGVNVKNNVSKIIKANRIKLRTHPRFSSLIA